MVAILVLLAVVGYAGIYSGVSDLRGTPVSWAAAIWPKLGAAPPKKPAP
jgi:hypothetical protein